MRQASPHLQALLLFLSVSLLVRMTVGIGVVSGLSMWPTLGPGDTVIFVRHLKPAEGSIVVADLPGHGLIIKRVAVAGGRPGVPPAVPVGSCFLVGDNLDHSYDSRSFGPLPHKLILGRVVIIWPDRGYRAPAERLPASSYLRARTP